VVEMHGGTVAGAARGSVAERAEVRLPALERLRTIAGRRERTDDEGATAS
jgi:hypothetical protein